ncbi:unannotated protein [freshwater metagenome]|uniref:Unannotated protein n=1 Tax=freshwater metagenome TaxID=449393 RepID=A0A6J6C6M5_9ZZZZ
MAHNTSLISAVELHVFQHHRHVLSWNFLADQPRHHLAQERLIGRWWQNAAGITEADDCFESAGANLSFLFLRQVALDLIKE